MSIFPLIGMPGATELLIFACLLAAPEGVKKLLSDHPDVLIFGAAKLPKLGKGLGEGIRNFKDGLKGEEKSEDKSDEKSPKLKD